MRRKSAGQDGNTSELAVAGPRPPEPANGTVEVAQCQPLGEEETGEGPGIAAPQEPHLPTDDDIKIELWKIATGEGSEASRVSALRALADIMGLMRAVAPPEFPEAMSAYMDALAIGLSRPPGPG